MAKWLKQSTAASVMFGPFLATSDGFTSKESFTALSGVMYKNSGASTTVTPVSASHTASGMYKVPLASGSMDTLGQLTFHFANSACHLPVWDQFMVVVANTYDSLVSGTDRIDAELAASGITTSTFAAGAINAPVIAASTIVASTLAAGAITGATLAASVIAASTFKAAAIEAAGIAASAISSTKFAGSAINAAVFAASAIARESIDVTGARKIADVTLRREWGEAASSNDGDTLTGRSLLGATAKQVNRIDATSTACLVVYRADDSTVLFRQVITACNNASPIVQLDTT